MEDGLPRLRGCGLAAYRAVWTVALAVAAAAAVGAQLRRFAPTEALAAATLLAVACLLFRRRPGDPIAAMLSLAFLLWTIARSSIWAEIGAAAVPLAVADRVRFLLLVSALMLFPAGRVEPGWTRLALAATAAAFGLGIAAAAGLVPDPLYVAPAMGCALLAVGAMRARFRALPPGTQRQQLKWAALGLAAGIFLVGLARIGAALLPYVPDAPALASALPPAAFDLGVAAIALGVMLSLLRVRLYDADAAISRSTAAAALTIILVGIFAGTEAVIQSASQSLFGDMTGTVSSGIAAAVAAACVAPIHGRAAHWAEARFQREIAALRRELPAALADLVEAAELEGLAEILLARIERGLRTSRAALLVDNAPVALRHVGPGEMERWRSGAGPWQDCPRDPWDRLFPLRLPLRAEGAGIVGWLLLGPRPDGSALGRDERAALEELAGPMARALCALRRRRASRRRIEAQSATIAALVRRLEALEAVHARF
jgi:hypothetical protein